MPLPSFLKRLRWVFVCAGLGIPCANTLADVRAELTTEAAYGWEKDGIDKAEAVLDLEWTGPLGSSTSFTVIPRVRVDMADSLDTDTRRPDNYSRINGPIAENTSLRLEMAEAYIDHYLGWGNMRLGKQQVVWGQADGLKVLDVVNPQNLREFNLPDFEDSRIPTSMLNVEIPTSLDSSVQLLVIPDLTFNELADPGSTFEITSPELVPAAATGVPVTVDRTQRPAGGNVESGVRWSAFVNGWDLSANYFYYYQDNPVVYRELANGQVRVTPTYERSHLAGITASNAFGDLVLRLELGGISDTYQIRSDLVDRGIHNTPEVASVVGLDYHGITDWMISYQWFQSTLTDYDDRIVRKRTTLRHTILLRNKSWNETLETRLFALLNQDHGDGQVRVKVGYQLADDWELWAGADLFFGDREGPFGQFRDTDRLLLGWETAF